MGSGVVGRLAHVQHLRAVLPQPQGRVQIERPHRPFERLVERLSRLPVEHGVVGEVGGRIRLIGRHDGDELILAHRLQRIVVASLDLDGRDRLLADLLPAHGPGAMPRIDHGVVRQGEQLLVERVVQQTRERVGRPPDRGPQVRATDVADEEGVPGEHRRRFYWAGGAVENQNRDRLWRVARCLEDSQTHIWPELDLGAVSHRLERVLRLGSGTEMDGRAGPLHELEMTRHEVGVKVGQEDVTNLERLALGVLEILVDVALRVHDGRDTGRIVRDHVGGMGQTA